MRNNCALNKNLKEKTIKRLLVIFVAVLFADKTYAASTLIYDGGGPWANIQPAMTKLGIPFDLRDPGNPVTLADLASHNLLIIGCNYSGDMTGLSAAVLASGITGNILLTGHDADVHIVHGYDSGSGGDTVAADASKFLSQAISWASGSGGRTGLIALADYSTAFLYLPAAWGISATGGLGGDNITSFTPAGLDSGVYNGLTPADMSNWGESYHAVFTAWGTGFSPFELGNSVVTIGTPEPATVCLLGLGALALMRKRR
jgi:hypothetical protein